MYFDIDAMAEELEAAADEQGLVHVIVGFSEWGSAICRIDPSIINDSFGARVLNSWEDNNFSEKEV